MLVTKHLNREFQIRSALLNSNLYGVYSQIASRNISEMWAEVRRGASIAEIIVHQPYHSPDIALRKHCSPLSSNFAEMCNILQLHCGPIYSKLNSC